MKSKFIITLLLTLFVGSISLTAQESNTTNEKKTSQASRIHLVPVLFG